MTKGLDRRAARTKRMLRGALTSLLHTKGYEQITVRDILDEANVGRSTFYSHCRGKEDLLRRGLRMLRSELSPSAAPKHTPGGGNGFTFSRKLLEHVAAHRRIYPSVARGRSRAVVFEELRSVALGLLRDELKDATLDPAMPRELTEELIVGTFMSLLTFWLEHDTEYGPAQVDALFQRFILQGAGLR
jgi:AcrR family transcriptional regulator